MKIFAALRQSVAVHAYDVIVVGGGHAGCEAATAAARMGANTLLLTHKYDTIGEMSCNPSFGGIGKGHLMREIDALDGVSPRICDLSGCHYKVLNRSCGPAVWGLRAQIDRGIYKKKLQSEISKTKCLTIKAASVEDICLAQPTCSNPINNPHIDGVKLSDGTVVQTKNVVITTGTFLRGELFIGLNSTPAGRMGDAATYGLSETFEKLGFRLSRLRTGTPPRLFLDSVDFSKTTTWKPDACPIPFSFMNERVWIKSEDQLDTYMTHTLPIVDQIVNETKHKNLHVDSDINAPRYCPSLESKVFKFPGRSYHIWLEPEGLTGNLVYPQGLSMTMPEEYQLKIINSIPGLENAKVARFGYGIHYDFIDPRQLKSSLETKLVNGLFLAGQINGTTGYEEAACQGIIAGINAASRCQDKGSFIVDRSDSYTGVLIDDLTSLGTNEPYRMFTARAEFRLTLRPDNADFRLTERGYLHGVVSEDRYRHFQRVKRQFEAVYSRLSEHKMSAFKWEQQLKCYVGNPNHRRSALDLVTNFNVTLKQLIDAFPETYEWFWFQEDLERRIFAEGLYARSIGEIRNDIAEVKREADMLLPDDIDYGDQQMSMSDECREKLSMTKPQTIGAASRIPGMTPSALVHLLRYSKRRTV